MFDFLHYLVLFYAGLWNIVQYFLDPVTKEKVKPCYSASEVVKYIDPMYLPPGLDGTSDFVVPDFDDLPETATSTASPADA